MMGDAWTLSRLHFGVFSAWPNPASNRQIPLKIRNVLIDFLSRVTRLGGACWELKSHISSGRVRSSTLNKHLPKSRHPRRGISLRPQRKSKVCRFENTCPIPDLMSGFYPTAGLLRR